MATETLAVKLALSLKTVLTRTDLDTPSPGSSTISDIMGANPNEALTNGVGLDQADVVFHETNQLASAVKDYEVVASATETDAWGTAINMAKIKCVFIHNLETTAAWYLEVGGIANGTNIFISSAPLAEFPIHVVHPGGILLIWNPSLAGYAAAGATDLLRVSSVTAAQTIDYEIVLIGTST